MRVLVINAGSSSLKLALLGADDTVVGRTTVEHWPGGADTREHLQAFVARHGSADVVGHRIVHGGKDFVGPVVIDDAVERALEALGGLAPLHQQRGLDGVRSTAWCSPA